MCKNLVEKGDLSAPLIIHNRTTKRAEDLSASLPKGTTTVAASVQEAVTKSDIIFTCLLNDQAVQDIYTSAAKENIKGKLFVDCSTVHPETTEVLAKSVLAQGADFVACPGELLTCTLKPNMFCSLWCPGDGREWAAYLRTGWAQGIYR
jgi:3-hydroxyisobutyrate dehydrogenase-like beta-hydroxyacid dehydrogenase